MQNDKLTSGVYVGIVVDCFVLSHTRTVEIVIVITDRRSIRIVNRYSFGRHYLRLQVVVHRVFLHLAVKLSSVHFLAEQRILRINEHNILIVKGEDFVFISTHIDGIAKMIGIFKDRLSIVRSLFRFFFGRCGGKDFSVLSSFCKLCPAFLLLFKPHRVKFFFLWI